MHRMLRSRGYAGANVGTVEVCSSRLNSRPFYDITFHYTGLWANRSLSCLSIGLSRTEVQSRVHINNPKANKILGSGCAPKAGSRPLLMEIQCLALSSKRHDSHCWHPGTVDAQLGRLLTLLVSATGLTPDVHCQSLSPTLMPLELTTLYNKSWHLP
jgi:hypothetical protein